MKRLLLTVACVLCAFAISATAAEGKKKSQMTDEQKSVHKKMLDKYDADKNGKLDKEEKAKMSAEDKKAMKAAFPKKEGEGAEKAKTEK